MRFSHSFCLLLTEFFLSIRTEISAHSLPLCQILQIFTINFQRYFRSKYKFCKLFECTRSLDLHLRELGVLAQACAISGPGHVRQETILSHLKWQKTSLLLYIYYYLMLSEISEAWYYYDDSQVCNPLYKSQN